MGMHMHVETRGPPLVLILRSHLPCFLGGVAYWPGVPGRLGGRTGAPP